MQTKLCADFFINICKIAEVALPALYSIYLFDTYNFFIHRLNSLKIQKIGDREFDIGKEFKSEEDYAEQAMKGLPLKQWTSNMIRNPVMSE